MRGMRYYIIIDPVLIRNGSKAGSCSVFWTHAWVQDDGYIDVGKAGDFLFTLAENDEGQYRQVSINNATTD